MNRQLDYSDERSNFELRLAAINKHRHPIALLLDGVKNPRNIGAIFRLADAARVEHIYLLNTELPQQKSLSKVARSTNKYVPHSVVNLIELDTILEKYNPVALEITTTSIPYSEVHPLTPLLLIIGEEAHGVSSTLLEKVSQSVHIPMYGINTSMNVASATAVVLFDFVHKIVRKID